MAERFWAPTRATVVPDAVVLALLQPSGQPAGDLGATVLAAHRAGAAAVGTIAKSAVPSEAGIVTAMATARGHVANAVVDAAGASMAKAYAPLFVRDFFDDAEESALSLYRAAVSKGVAPSMAAVRVGAVYGVPSKHLGPYAALACDPRANPVALTDAADKVLLAFVSKTVDIETDAKEPISKAGTLQLERATHAPTWDEADVHRDGGGRFASSTSIADPAGLARIRALTGVGAQAAPTVATEPSTAALVRNVTRGRLKRLSRVRHLPSSAPAKTEPKTEDKTATKVSTTRVASKLATGKLTSAQKLSHKVLAALATDDADPDHDVPTRAPVSFPRDLLTMPKSDDFGDCGDIAEEHRTKMVYTLTRREGQEFAAASGGGADTALFRLGHLSAATDGGAELDTEASEDKYEATANVELITTFGVPELPVDPVVEEIDQHALNQALSEVLSFDRKSVTENFIRAAKKKLLKRWVTLPSGEQVEETQPGELPHVFAREDYHGKLGTLLVHIQAPNPDGPGFDPKKDRPFPKVVELYLENPQGRVDDDGTRYGKADVLVNMNQAYQLGPVELLYDAERQVLVDRYPIRPVDEEDVSHAEHSKGFKRTIGKALATLDFRETNVHRDASGQFSSVASRRSGVAPTHIPDTATAAKIKAMLAPAPPARPLAARRNRISSIARIKRLPSSRPAPASPAATEADLRTQSTRTSTKLNTKVATRAMATNALVSAKIQAAMKPAALKDQYLMDDSQEFSVMARSTFVKMMKAKKTTYGYNKPFADPEVPGQMSLGYEGKGVLNGRVPWAADLALESVGWRATSMGSAGTLKDIGDAIPYRPGNPDDQRELNKKVKDIFDRHPQVGFVRLQEKASNELDDLWGAADWDELEFPEPGSAGFSLQYQLQVNEEAIEPLYLVELDKSIDWSAHDIDLVHQGTFRSNGLAVDPYPHDPKKDLTEMVGVHSIEVHVYKAVHRGH